MPVTSKPAQGHTNWTTGLNTQVQDPGSKKTTGWIADDIPPFEFENWLQWTLDQWEQYFEYITDLHTTQIAALTITVGTLGTASAISASTAGHTTLTGANVQLQLDETDAALKDLYDAITAGKGIDLVGYDPVAPGNWSPTPTHAGPALDQLAARMVAVEAAAQNVVFTDHQFSDFVVDPADPTDGAGNTGLTSNGTVNPRGLSLSDLTTKYAEERIVFQSIERTGNFDSAGRPEWRIITPSNEIRVLFYGQWADPNHSNAGFPTTAFYVGVNGSWNKKVLYGPGDYFLVTGVFDGIGLNTSLNGLTYSQDIEVVIDGVNTGVPLNLTGQALNGRGNSFMTFSDPSMMNLGHNIHTVKFTQNDGSNPDWNVNGVTLIHSSKYQMPGKAWVAKALISYPTKSTISDPGVGLKGAKVMRYIDRVDTVIKDAVNNVIGNQTSVSGSVGSGSTTISVVSAAGFVAGDIIEITDGPTNMERLKIQSVGGNNITVPSPGTIGSYTNPTVLMYGKGPTVADHSNERLKAKKHARSFSNGDTSYADVGNFYGGGTYFYFDDDGASNVKSDSTWAYRTAAGPSGWYHSEFGIYPTSTDAKFTYRFVGTGLDVLLDNGVVSGGGTIGVFIDGVDCGVLANTGNENKWYKVCSDLPEGQHTVIFHISASGTANFSMVEWKEYECAYPALFNTTKRGNILSMRTIRPSYLFDGNFQGYRTDPIPNQTDQSRGVIDQSLMRNARIFSPTQSWATQQNQDLSYGFQLYQASGAQTGDYIEQYFFGTGFDLGLQYTPASGIDQITIDGNVASAANFPSMVVTGLGYNSSNGKIDGYAAVSIERRISFANVSMTPAWHKVRITITGTKNPSSSDFQIFVQGALAIHNMPFETDMPNEIVGACGELKVGGALDLRLKGSDDDGIPAINFCRSLSATQDSVSPSDPQVTNHLTAKLKTHGYPVKFNFGYSMYTNTAGSSIIFEAIIDGRSYSSEYIYQFSPLGDPNHYEWSAILNLPAGFHSFRFHIMPSQGLFNYYGSHINVEEQVPSQRRKIV